MATVTIICDGDCFVLSYNPVRAAKGDTLTFTGASAVVTFYEGGASPPTNNVPGNFTVTGDPGTYNYRVVGTACAEQCGGSGPPKMIVE